MSNQTIKVLLVEDDPAQALLTKRVLEHAAALDPDSAHVVYHLALVKERLGEEEEAAPLFERATSLDPHHYLAPLDVSAEFFQGAAEDAVENLPRSIREYIENLPMLIEDFPSTDLITRERVSPQLLGIFIGIQLISEGVALGYMAWQVRGT